MDDWFGLKDIAVVYVGVAVLGAAVLATLWRYTPYLRPPWLPMQRIRRISWQGVDVFMAFLIIESVLLLVDTFLRDTGFFHWLYGAAIAMATESAADNATTSAVDQSMLAREQLWSFALAAPLELGLILLGLNQIRGTRLSEIGLTRTRGAKNFALGLGLWVIITPFSQVIHSLALMTTPAEWVEAHPLNQAASESMAFSEWFVLLTGAIILAPLLEEVIFRGLLFPWQLRAGLPGQWIVLTIAVYVASTGGYRGEQKPYNPAPVAFVLLMLLPAIWMALADARRSSYSGLAPPKLAVYANGLFFAAMHSRVWPSPIPLFLLGLALAWMRYRTSSLVGAVTLHSLFNAVAALSLLA